ncbi:PAAR domain-containing protein [Enterobacter cloacae complex sp. ECC445]|uniref:PAAR domain-containing protein n=1 Tax=Enterobacter cloacae complex sp. ECC445 TaxID=2913213 RepID=UPI001F271E36|nr:PAAR domain-containing protein [Enterobacter cloacae complex sp. ECC445]MCG0457015.1 PAAR domain-containing protein [Enterobacter cloacae complex sp. ECC445]
MSTGFWVVQGDKTTCGGSVLTGHPKGKKIGPNQNRQATVGCQVSCGKHPGTYSVAGGYPGESIHGQLAASTLYSRSTCPCKSFFIATHTFMRHGPYQAPVKAATAPVAEKAVTEPVQEPEQHAQTARKHVEEQPKPQDSKREPVDAGFCVLPFGAETGAYEPWLFTGEPPAGTRELYRALNGAGKEYKAGSILLVVDPDKQDSDQIAHMQAAKARIDTALAPLSHQQANFLYKHKDTIEMFAAAATTANDAAGNAGRATEAAKGYFERVEKILVEIEKTYKNQYITSGTLIGEQFFVERRRLFGQLDSVLKMFMKHRFMFNEYTDLKSALGLSSRSITHRWNETGVSDIEGYATHIEKLAKYVKLMETAGKIGLGLSALDTAAKITEACTVGRDCEKTAFTSIGEFSGSLLGGRVATKILAGSLTETVCVAILGAATFEAGGAGALLCTIGVAGGVSYGSDKAISSIGGLLGEKLYEATSDD